MIWRERAQARHLVAQVQRRHGRTRRSAAPLERAEPALDLLLAEDRVERDEPRLRTLALEGAELDLFGVLNDRTADGRDVSWVWDADWEIVAPHVRRLTCSGTRAAELALRLKYAGVDPQRLEVVDDLERGLDRALAGGDGPLYALPTYTALLELKDVLSRRGHQEYWR